MELSLSFFEAAKGCTKHLSVNAHVPCDSCCESNKYFKIPLLFTFFFFLIGDFVIITRISNIYIIVSFENLSPQHRCPFICLLFYMGRDFFFQFVFYFIYNLIA